MNWTAQRDKQSGAVRAPGHKIDELLELLS